MNELLLLFNSIIVSLLNFLLWKKMDLIFGGVFLIGLFGALWITCRVIFAFFNLIFSPVVKSKATSARVEPRLGGIATSQTTRQSAGSDHSNWAGMAAGAAVTGLGTGMAYAAGHTDTTDDSFLSPMHADENNNLINPLPHEAVKGIETPDYVTDPAYSYMPCNVFYQEDRDSNPVYSYEITNDYHNIVNDTDTGFGSSLDSSSSDFGSGMSSFDSDFGCGSSGCGGFDSI